MKYITILNFVTGTVHQYEIDNSVEDFEEFMKVSAATAQACGVDRIIAGARILKENVDDIPPETLSWGVGYLMQFFR